MVVRQVQDKVVRDQILGSFSHLLHQHRYGHLEVVEVVVVRDRLHQQEQMVVLVVEVIVMALFQVNNLLLVEQEMLVDIHHQKETMVALEVSQPMLLEVEVVPVLLVLVAQVPEQEMVAQEFKIPLQVLL
jgi:hypothetical protein